MSNYIVILLGIFTIIDATASRGAPLWREMYGFIFLMIFFSIFYKVQFVKFKKSIFSVSVIFFGLSYIVFMMVLLQPIMYPVYIIGDYIVVLFPIGLLLLYGVDSKLYQDTNINILLRMLFFAAVIAPLVANKLYSAEYNWVDRFDPPHILLFSAIWVFSLSAKGNKRYLFILANILMLVLTFYSGKRTSVVLWLLSGSFIILYAFQMLSLYKKIFFTIIISSIVGVITLYISANINTIDLGRFNTTAEKGIEGDPSMMGRVFEALDVIRITKQEKSVLLILFGHGLGATFEADIAYKRGHPNLTKENRIHHIHIGPALLFYRFGLFAFLAYFILLFLLIVFLVNIRNNIIKYNLSNHDLIFIISFFIELVNFTMRNVLIDPLYSYILVGVVIIYLTKIFNYNKISKRNI